MPRRVLALVLVACTDRDHAVAGPCAPSGSAPATIADVVDRINALPSPVTLPCFVSSLPRPLPLEATSDVFSAQPAMGERSPRMFVWYGAETPSGEPGPQLTLTVVPEGPGAALLEIGEATDDGLTVKAEIEMPAEAPLDERAPYERVVEADGSGTGCGVCHGGETAVDEGVYASVPFQPLPSLLVPLSRVHAEAVACGSATDDRCALLRAVFDHGEVVHAPFPADMPTIYGPR